MRTRVCVRGYRAMESNRLTICNSSMFSYRSEVDAYLQVSIEPEPGPVSGLSSLDVSGRDVARLPFSKPGNGRALANTVSTHQDNPQSAFNRCRKSSVSRTR